jgi:uncharacterized membrane protein
MLLFQSARLFIPLPPFISLFVIGSAVNACLLLAVEQSGWRLALVLAVIAPVIAYFQQVLLLPLFIIPVAAANATYVLGYRLSSALGRWPAVGIATLVKAGALYILVNWLISWLQLPGNLAAIMSMMFGWPQLITGLGGGILCFLVFRRTRRWQR